MSELDRRSFLKRGSLLAGAAVAGTTVFSRMDAAAAAQTIGGVPRRGRGKGGYGPLARKTALNEPTGPEYFALPEGFEYVVFSKVGDTMSDGTVVPRSHDGMGAFALPGRRVRLIRNHENRNAAGVADRGVLAPGMDAAKYDPMAYGGTTTIDFDVKTMTMERDFVSCIGTTVNCAGGLMLDNAGWITSEETTAGPNQGFAQKHGYNFIVPVDADTAQTPQPLTAMGRFAHEAIAVDPRTGIVYETEDSGNDSGFYRFIPTDPRNLAAGGQLQMLGIAGFPGSYVTLTGQVVGKSLPVRWVDITDPDPDLEGGAPEVAIQGIAAGGAQFNRLEGIWWSGDRCFFNSTSGGNAQFGQVWEYRPDRSGNGTLTLIYESTGFDPNIGRTPLDSPDNLTITPRGGILLCEDDSNPSGAIGAANDTHPLAPGITDVNRLIGLGDDGLPFEFAVHTFNDTELAGACFAKNAKDVLFVNTFGDGTPGSGATFAITGPWSKGAL
jgi:secreted PhoX family phosphatase